MVDLTQAHKASIELLGTRHTALVEAVRNYVNGSVQPSIDELIAAIEDVTTDIDTKEKMLLGLASRQATKPVPSLILDFKTRHYLQGTRRPEKGYGIHDLLTVERATPKWVYSASGKLTEVPANEPAYQHDPVTGEPQGLLIEEGRTNILSEGPNFPTYLATGPTEANVETVQAEDPFGVTRDVCKFVLSNGVSVSYYLGYFGLDALDTESGNPVSGSFFFYPDGFDVVQLGIRGSDTTQGYIGVTCNLLTGERVANSVAWGVPEEAENIIIERLSNGWVRLGFGAVLGQGTGPERVEISVSNMGSDVVGDGVKGVLYTCPQFENNAARPSSYIPVTDSPVTRAADNVYRELGEEFNNNAFTIYAEGVQGSDNGSLFFMGGEGGLDNSLRVGVPTSGGRVMYLSIGGTTVAIAGPSAFPSYTMGEPAWVAVSVSADTGQLILAINGEAVVRTIPNIPVLTLLRVGAIASNNNNINGTMSDVTLYPIAHSEQELIDLTS